MPQLQAVHKGLIKHLGNAHENHGKAVDQGVKQHHGKPVSRQHGGKHRRTEEGQILEQAYQPGNEGMVPVALQRRHEGQSRQGVGHQTHGKAGGAVGEEPPLPAQGHGVEGIAHPAYVEISRQEHHHHSGVKTVHIGHGRQPLVQGQGHRQGLSLGRQGGHPQHQEKHINHPAGGKPGQILAKDRPVKEVCSGFHSPSLPAHR